MLAITYIPIFTDNYVWVVTNPTNRQCVIVDPGEAQPVLDFLANENFDLHAILITHGHWDHVNGIEEILNHYPDALLYAPKKSALNDRSVKLSDGDIVTLPPFDLNFQIIETPGHTLDHIAYYSAPYLFCGDTLFSAGCGRLLGGTAEQLYHSLCRLAQLPDDTQVYCTHEYTLNNLAFALTIEPDNLASQRHLEKCQQLRRQGLPTLPSSIGLEKQINPFLRCDNPNIVNKLNLITNASKKDQLKVFSNLRQRKDQF